MLIGLADQSEFLAFDDVEARLVEAWGFLMRMPDREHAWLNSGISSIWRGYILTKKEARRLYQIDGDDYDKGALPKLPGLTVAEVDRMNEALGWIERWVGARDQKLFASVLWQLQRESRPSWLSLASAFNADADALRMRYNRGINTICRRVNG